MYSRLLRNPLVSHDGISICNEKEWSNEREYLLRTAEEVMYGKWPGKPNSVTVISFEQEMCSILGVRSYIEHVVLRVNGIFSFKFSSVRPQFANPIPTVVYNVDEDEDLMKAAAKVVTKGFGLVEYKREQISPYKKGIIEKDKLFSPEFAALNFSCGVIMAWAWAYTVIADYLQNCAWCGKNIAAGHSRGGKTALCAGLYDDRYCIVAPIGSGCGGLGCARFIGTCDGVMDDPSRCETIGRMATNFPYWMTDRYSEYGSCEKPFGIGDEVVKFPIDAHLLRAAIAPRAVISSEGIEDDWCNPFGNQLCWQAANSVFELLGVPQNNGFFIHNGKHEFSSSDWDALLAFVDYVNGNEKQIDGLNKPYFNIELSKYMEQRA